MSFSTDPDEYMPVYLLEYDAAGRELARRTLPPLPPDEPSYATALFGLATPMTEAASLIGVTRRLRSEMRSTGDMEVWVLYDYLTDWIWYFIPGGGRRIGMRSGPFAAYTAFIVLSAAVCALACYLLARRYAFSRAGRLGWAVAGLLFGWVGLALMLAVQDWPVRVRCPSCGRPRRVDRDRCEHCDAPHAPPALDGTEVFETTAAATGKTHNAVYQTTALPGGSRP
jgi:hypothetical protein